MRAPTSCAAIQSVIGQISATLTAGPASDDSELAQVSLALYPRRQIPVKLATSASFVMNNEPIG